MNSMQLKDKLKQISKKKNIDFNILLRLYMYDRFIERLSLSKYKDHFILKGGFYLSILFGVESRSTMDIDTAFRNAEFTQENIRNMIQEIIAINNYDNTKLTITNISSIRENNKYNGFRVDLLVQLDNIKEKFHIDIATGDPITPCAISYHYKTTLEDKTISVWAYNLETVLAEKLETIFERGESNGRTRDFYDVYLIYKHEWNQIDIDILKEAVKITFKKRNFVGDMKHIITLIKNSDILKKRWINYTKKYEYAENIDFDEIIYCLEQFVDMIEPLEWIHQFV